MHVILKAHFKVVNMVHWVNEVCSFGDKYLPSTYASWCQDIVSFFSPLLSGGWDADGRGPCVWDTFTHQGGERVFENQTGDVACGSYTLWEEDLKCIKQLGLTHYRFSLSWSRLLPDGTTGFINQKGKCFLKIEGCSFNSRSLLQSGIINPACCSAGQLWNHKFSEWL